MLGSWKLTTQPHAILGPNHLFQHFQATKDEKTGDSWFTLIEGQEFRVSGSSNEMQYCFSVGAIPVSEQSPFYIDSVNESRIEFCWRGKPMPTHAAGCQACSCANIIIELTTDDTLDFIFHMSPPVRHAWASFRRKGPAPPVFELKSFLGGKRCDYVNHTGLMPLLTPNASEAPVLPVHTCPKVKRQTQLASRANMSGANPLNRHECRQLDGLSHLLDKTVPDIRFQYVKPRLSCWPCEVSYSVSAKIQENEYISVGFKGMGYAIKFNDKKIRPNYFGMSTDPVDEERGGSAIALGYGNCLREMKTADYVGTPTDVLESERKLSHTSVERRNGRTILRFKVHQHVGRDPQTIEDFFGDPIQGSARVMWAIGEADSMDCNAMLGYHDYRRGVAPLNWLSVGSYMCKYDRHEMEPSQQPALQV